MQVLAKGGKGKNRTLEKVAVHVNRDHQLVFVLPGDVVRGLIDDVHEDGGQVGHHEYTEESPLEDESDIDLVDVSGLLVSSLHTPLLHYVVAETLWSQVLQKLLHHYTPLGKYI